MHLSSPHTHTHANKTISYSDEDHYRGSPSCIGSRSSPLVNFSVNIDLRFSVPMLTSSTNYNTIRYNVDPAKGTPNIEQSSIPMNPPNVTQSGP